MAGELTASSTRSGNLASASQVQSPKCPVSLAHASQTQTKAGNDIPIPGQRDRPKSFMDLKPQRQTLKYITYGLRRPFHGSLFLLKENYILDFKYVSDNDQKARIKTDQSQEKCNYDSEDFLCLHIKDYLNGTTSNQSTNN